MPLSKKYLRDYGVKPEHRTWLTLQEVMERIKRKYLDLPHSAQIVRPISGRIGLVKKAYLIPGTTKRITIFRPPKSDEIRMAQAKIRRLTKGRVFLEPRRGTLELTSASHLMSLANAATELIRIKGLGRDWSQAGTQVSSAALVAEMLQSRDFESPATDARPELISRQYAKALFELHKKQDLSAKKAIIYMVLKAPEGLKQEEVAEHFNMTRANVGIIVKGIERHMPEGMRMPTVNVKELGRRRKLREARA
ncbi:MAG: hypothetical protein ABH863_02185 [Candidatus Micrarchaeota archaeon]